MKYRRYSQQEVIDKTREVIHLFTDKKVDAFLRCLDKDFSWVADTEGIFMQGVGAFAENVESESRLPPVEITQEEYAVAAHERKLWVVYGRFTVAGLSQMATVHFTFAWIQRQNDLFLGHANASHAQPDTAPAESTTQAAKLAQARMFLDKPVANVAPVGAPGEKVRFRDMAGRTHFLFAHEIFYIKSMNLLCEVHTEQETFQTRATLRDLKLPGFFLIHRSYLVNTYYVNTIRRFQATLLDGTELPISRERYMDLKRHLQTEHR
ncbi:DUF4440 domain-containing protein [Pseudoflavonifractor sp. BIOML-A6]|jgi:hypothetical protein|nr:MULTISPECIES: LytTR family DNA-binding domain-containing protein [unclassified Pseudoflavonifractor]MTQ96853.1 DUF4440 domain-containing protein [Pseudoflavonifractor sp. BIOML-A16]MTR05054.1 DUF4440 domain-containing protein [Pseudoflavonifractor sp. BIOML-A15]MTR32675.1 DUF4440 domain-containing protein [Pseudoflavonifractor sp. BIOML-A14]MTR72069.1 DUF4440 domain-containing protein [Pseudoflavonifractor sp. BIOML-A18]MTS65105.1 DUF4440 domain-containing protein [Pseudoflavonifractor sp. 